MRKISLSRVLVLVLVCVFILNRVFVNPARPRRFRSTRRSHEQDVRSSSRERPSVVFGRLRRCKSYGMRNFTFADYVVLVEMVKFEVVVVRI